MDKKEIPGLPGYFVTKNGRVFSKRKELAIQARPDGYRQVMVQKDGNPSCHLVHRLVLSTFHGPCPPGMECCHEDGTRSNNRIDNLRWDTRSGNQRDRAKHGTGIDGENSHFAKLSLKEVQGIRASDLTQRKLAKQYGVSQSCISKIKNNTRWREANG